VKSVDVVVICLIIEKDKITDGGEAAVAVVVVVVE
jgi:hypothetical protein